jgi:aminobenzoyl-glutamate utilization protein A
MTLDAFDWGKLENELVALRREFHTYPESGWTEFRTTARIIEELEALGLTVQYGPSIHVKEKMFGLPKPDVLEACWERARAESDRPDLIDAMRGGYTGCLTVIEGAYPGPTTGIRVDIDCNDVEEATTPDHCPVAKGFRSTHKNCMHACGHDAHAAIGIGAAKILTACRDQLHGRVILVFQPGEEGLRGAASLTAAGHFSGCDYFFGGHVGMRDLPVGTVAASGYGFLASTKFDVAFHGVPSHAGASPELGKNAMAAAATAVLNMLAIPRHSAGASRINIGTFHAGTGRNVIPAEAELTVETRGATGEINAYMEDAAKRVCESAAAMYGCTCDTVFMGASDSVECDEALAVRAGEILATIPGVTKVIGYHQFDFGGGEDVTTMMRDVQAHGGMATELVFGMPLVAAHHNNYFDVDETVIPLAARAFATLAISLGENPIIR